VGKKKIYCSILLLLSIQIKHKKTPSGKKDIGEAGKGFIQFEL